MRKIIYYILLASVVMASACTAQAVGYRKFQREFYNTFDTVVVVVAYARSQQEFDALSDIVQSRMLRFHRLFDIYRNYEGVNNLKTVNDNAGIRPVKVDKDIIGLLGQSQLWYQETGGMVNVAMGCVLRIWHDYREAGELGEADAKLPPKEALEEAARHTDIGNMIIDEAGSTIYLADPEMRLDVGAIAKGYAVEAITDELIALGYDSVLLSAGGNIRAIGSPRDGQRDKWRVGIAKPEMSFGIAVQPRELLDVAYVNDMSVVSSGGYERYYLVDGAAYHHLIDPITLFPANYYKAVTVFTQDSEAADVLSTALFLIPPEEALEFAKGLEGVEALWVMPDNSLMVTDGINEILYDPGGGDKGGA